MNRHINDLTAARASLTDARAAVRHAENALNAAIIAARDAGVTGADIAAAAGVTRGRVSQIAPIAAAAAQKNTSPEWCDKPAEDVPTLAQHITAGRPLISHRTTNRLRQPYGRTTYTVDGHSVVEAHTGHVTAAKWADAAPSLTELITIAAGVEAANQRYLICQPMSTIPAAGNTQTKRTTQWALDANLPADWTAQGHYLADPTMPTLRFKNKQTGKRVTIIHAGQWFGPDVTLHTAQTVAEAWAGLETNLTRVPAWAGIVGLADTPATTGRALWARTIPAAGWAQPSDEIQQLIRHTTGQGRIEVMKPAADTIPAFTVMDGRLMYASLTHSMPVGKPRLWTGVEVEALDARGWTNLVRGRGRWRVSFEVPAGWEHVGLIPRWTGQGWEYPRDPGRRFTTWADGAEIWTAVEAGWNPQIHEGISWAEGKPLDRWTRELTRIHAAAEQAAAAGNAAAGLASKAIRAIILHAIGAFASRGHDTTHIVKTQDSHAIPAGAEVHHAGANLIYTQANDQTDWAAGLSHPEWAATIWARARNRLLTGRGVENQRTGALTLPPSQIVGFATDAIYLTEPVQWADDGRAGRLRHKGTLGHAAAWPTNLPELWDILNQTKEPTP